jgi:short-subunit dehydrogenase
MSLNAKNILLTGPSSGLGFELAKYFWSLGANLFLITRTQESAVNLSKLFIPKGTQFLEFIICDLSNEKSLLKLESKITNLQIDCLVNNAGIQGPIGEFQKNDFEDWSQTLQVNLLAPALLMRYVITSMKQHLPSAAGLKSIINLSGGGVTSPRPYFSAYVAAKSALVGLSATLASELKESHIHINCVAPGPMPSNMLKSILDAGPTVAGIGEFQIAREMLIGGDAPDTYLKVARLCEFLIGESGKFITGKLISAKWDSLEEIMSHKEEIISTDIYTMRRIVPSDRGFSW